MHVVESWDSIVHSLPTILRLCVPSYTHAIGTMQKKKSLDTQKVLHVPIASRVTLLIYSSCQSPSRPLHFRDMDIVFKLQDSSAHMIGITYRTTPAHHLSQKWPYRGGCRRSL